MDSPSLATSLLAINFKQNNINSNFALGAISNLNPHISASRDSNVGSGSSTSCFQSRPRHEREDSTSSIRLTLKHKNPNRNFALGSLPDAKRILTPPLKSIVNNTNNNSVENNVHASTPTSIPSSFSGSSSAWSVSSPEEPTDEEVSKAISDSEMWKAFFQPSSSSSSLKKSASQNVLEVGQDEIPKLRIRKGINDGFAMGLVKLDSKDYPYLCGSPQSPQSSSNPLPFPSHMAMDQEEELKESVRAALVGLRVRSGSLVA